MSRRGEFAEMFKIMSTGFAAVQESLMSVGHDLSSQFHAGLGQDDDFEDLDIENLLLFPI